MTASDFPITTGYGQIPGYPLNNGFHKGQDRAMPNGTPVVVNGVTIALSNNTGASTGSHLHIGRFVNGQPTNPNSGGFQFNSAVVFDTGYDTSNGNYVRITADGALWVYLHLQSILVNKGQQLTGASPGGQVSTVGEVEFHDLYIAFFGPMELNQPTADDRKRWIGSETNTVIRSMQEDPRYAAYAQYVKDLEKAQAANAPVDVVPYDGPPLYKKKGT